MIKHISFDLWDTIIKRNPEFGNQRVKYISKFMYNQGRRLIKDEDIKQAIADVSVFNTQVSMITGEHSLKKHGMYALVLNKLGLKITYSSMEDKLHKFVDDIDQIFENYLPIFIINNTLEVIKSVIDRGISVSLVSNTGYANAVDIQNYFVYSNLYKFFDAANCYFSDITGLAKPNSQLFSTIVQDSGYEPGEILHIGDNKIADGGCTAVGMNFSYVDIMHTVGECVTIEEAIEEALKTK